MTYTVRDFLFQMYKLISASNPTVPLHGSDDSVGMLVLNQLLQAYAGNGLMLTIAKTVTAPVDNTVDTVVFVDPSFVTDSIQTEAVTLTIASPSFTVLNGAVYQLGDVVTGSGIPANTTILSIVGNLVTLTANAAVNGTSILTFTHPLPTPGVVYIKEGRLANLDSAWLLLSGVTYPLIDKSRDDYLAAWKYDPLKGLPRFVITFPDTDRVNLRLYPAPSQFFTFMCRGKFQLATLTKDSDMSSLPQYFIRYLLFACARDVAFYKGRADAWTQKLENMYIEARDIMESTSEVNLAITGDEQSLLNGAWRVRAGI
jgi:hypothetical protein